jgi:hypothetical protein
MSLFFSDNPRAQAEAVSVCAECPVQGACELETRRQERPWLRFGVRAGLTAEQRRAWGREASNTGLAPNPLTER